LDLGSKSRSVNIVSQRSDFGNLGTNVANGSVRILTYQILGQVYPGIRARFYPGKSSHSLSWQTMKWVSRKNALSGQVYPGRKLYPGMKTLHAGLHLFCELGISCFSESSDLVCDLCSNGYMKNECTCTLMLLL
jgi:hypothetical protein